MPMTEITTNSAWVQPHADNHRLIDEDIPYLHAVIGTVATRLAGLHPREIGSTIDWALGVIGQAAGVDRCSLYRVSERGNKLKYYYEWCAQGIRSSLGSLETLPVEIVQAWVDRIGSVDVLHVPDINDLSQSSQQEMDLLRNLGVRSILVVPIRVLGNLFGCLSFSTVANRKQWNDGTTTLLKLVVGLISSIFDKQRIMDQVQRNEERFRAIFEGAATGVSLVDPSGRLIECNLALAKMLGYSQDELQSLTFADVTYPDDRERDLNLYRQLISGDLDHYQIEKRYATKDGRILWIRLSVAPLGRHSRMPAATIRVLEDITEDKRNQQVLQRYQLLVDNARDIVVYFNAAGHIIEANQAAIQAYGYSREELLSMSVHQLRYAAIAEEVAIQMGQAQNGVLYETVHQRRDGSVFAVEVSCKSRTVGEEDLFISIIRDITDRRKAEAAIRFLDRHDKLTGFYNRAYFEALLRDLDHERNLPLSVVVGDLNGLKQINVALGESYGDKLLVKTAEIIRDTCGQDVLASRWGDDEFAVILPNTDEDRALRICEEIHQTCGHRRLGPVQPNLSLGTATKKHSDDHLQEICQSAEERMYRNKFLEQQSPRSSLVASLARTLRERNLETEEHAQRLEQIAAHMAKAMGLPHDKLDELRLLATLHDIGKVGIPDDILMKPDPLTASEWKIMRKHSEIGYRIAEATPEFTPIARAILTHHERWDGKGYPLRLNGEEIPLIARIISIIDAYDVMTNGRPYKAAVSSEVAIAEIQRCAGSQFDPQLVEAFVGIYGNQDAERVGSTD